MVSRYKTETFSTKESSMSNFWATLVKWFGPGLNAIKGTINLVEFGKALLLAFSVGGGLWGVLTSLQTSLGKFVVDPTVLADLQQFFTALMGKNWIGATVVVITLVAEIFRRMNQGIDVVPHLPIIRAEMMRGNLPQMGGPSAK